MQRGRTSKKDVTDDLIISPLRVFASHIAVFHAADEECKLIFLNA